MDQTQFNRLQKAVQYAVADSELQRHGQPPRDPGGWRWMQSAWGYGRVTKRRRRRKVDQQYFQVACPTTGCVAGTIVIQNGDHLVVPTDAPLDAVVQTDYCMDKTGEYHDIEERAMDLLGVEDEGDLHGLFSGGLGINSVVDTARLIAEENGFQLELQDA